MGSVAVRDVVRDVVAEVAPEELPVVNGLAAFDDATVVRRLRRGGDRGQPLGFGLGEIAVMVAPVVWIVVDQIAQKVADTAVNGAAKGTKALLRKVFRKGPARVVIPPLTAAQLVEVRKKVREAALQRGMSEERAQAVADAVVARLTLGEADEEDPG
ncbi:hypothetical protein NLX83_24065 [Allokutzneria sp. A3M-2-11 16]|uniref:hypothetical protein n=1 Tax=Allokutzneria sp. A3M-2-11 16 TaxID=2962043 RepID=UPI0020B709B3|nr:hypothetical protein [Allokutzneria sp. A3M-2-11 16]MCP3802349.1 hypothetical protein [Allokutzneria sp. A3M-2-11 16]